MIFHFEKRSLSLDLRWVRIWKTEFVWGVLLKAFYYFRNFQKMFWAWVSWDSNFLDSFSKAAYYCLIKISWKHHRRLRQKYFKKKAPWSRWEGNTQYSWHLLPHILSRKFIFETSTKTKIPNCIFFFSTKYNGDSHGGISTTSYISFQLRRTWSCLNSLKAKAAII